MGTYEIFLTVVFLILTVIFALCGVKACAQAIKETEKKPRKMLRQKALFWMALSLVFLLCALYVLFRISWFMLAIFLMGTMVVAFVIGSGVAANMHKH